MQKIKNYRKIFWLLFGLGVLVNLPLFLYKSFPNLVDLRFISLVSFFVVVFFWMKYFNSAWNSIGKKHGWIVGLIPLVPFGSLIAIAIAYHYLKETDYWRGEYKSFSMK